MNEEQTSPEAASAASRVLKDEDTGQDSKTAAGSALSKAGPGGIGNQTGEDAAQAASDVLRDGRTAEDSKTAAGSALAQTPEETQQGQ